METAALVVMGFKYYCAIGGIVAVLFLLIGIDRIDPSARGAYAFRPLLIPGICLLWPIVLIRWFQLESSQKDDA